MLQQPQAVHSSFNQAALHEVPGAVYEHQATIMIHHHQHPPSPLV
jgi:hypothetical protein